MVSNYFNDFGAHLANEWQRFNFDSRAFADLASIELTRWKPWNVVSPTDVVWWLTDRHQLPNQVNLDGSFGEPPITLFWHPRFFIEALHWAVGSPLVHQHAFAGAFAVWHGSSVHSRFTFRVSRRLNAAMSVGHVQFEDVRVLPTGAVEPIHPGSALIHSTFHLDTPSITIVVRTHSDREYQPQYSYYQPSLAMDPFFRDPTVIRRVQLLSYLDRIHSDLFDEAARRSIAASDIYGAYRILECLWQSSHGQQALSMGVECARAYHGDVIDQLQAVLFERGRQEVIKSRRAVVRSSELRFFLALLMSVPTSAGILAAIRMRYPDDDPRELAMRWSLAFTAEVSGIEFDDVNRVIFRCLLDALPHDAIVATLSKRFELSASSEESAAIRKHCDDLKQSIFGPLLGA
jgi:hypothetical protein